LGRKIFFLKRTSVLLEKRGLTLENETIYEFGLGVKLQNLLFIQGWILSSNVLKLNNKKRNNAPVTAGPTNLLS